MWHSRGDISFYVYAPGKVNECGDNFETGFRLIRGEWCTVEIEVRVNDASDSAFEKNGEMRLRINGKELLHIPQFVFRETSDGEVDTLLWSNFFGGNDSSWKPREDTFMDFDSILVTELEHNDDPSSSASSASSSSSAVLFSVIALLGLLAIAAVFVFWRRNRRNHKRRNSDAIDVSSYYSSSSKW
jgi:hypothetical protein